MNPQLWWYLARASGIVAWALLVGSFVWGVLLTTRVLKPRDRPAWLLDLHRWLGGVAACMVALHVTAIVADSYVHFRVADVLVPFAASWRPLAVALGVVSLWLLAAVQATSLAMRHLPRRAWRAVHLTSYGLVWLVSVHAGLAGSDTVNVLYRVVALVLTAGALAATWTRLVAGPRRLTAVTGAARGASPGGVRGPGTPATPGAARGRGSAPSPGGVPAWWPSARRAPGAPPAPMATGGRPGRPRPPRFPAR